MTVISAANIKFYGSGAANLGGAISGSEVMPATLFDAVSGAEAAAGDVEYRCVYVKNTDANANGLQGAFAWLDANTPATGDLVEIGLATQGKNGEASTIADEGTAPSPTVTFAACATKGAGLSLGTLSQNDYYAVWIRRTVSAGAGAYNANGFTVKVEGDSSA
jgi:hypothetical protein